MKLLSFVGASALVLLSFGALRAQTVDDIINKHIDAVGGRDAWKKVNAVKMTCTATAQGTDIGIVLTGVENKGFRTDIAVMGMNGYTFVTPTEGWVYMPFQGQQKPEAMTADQVKDAQSQFDIQGELLDYQAKGTKAELIGKEDVEGTECWKLKVTLKSGKTKTEFFDPTSYFLIREVDKVKANGKESDQTTDFSNYQKLPEGITMPRTITSGMGDLVIKSIEINPAIADNLFKLDTTATK
jgi:hypothetical protein